MNDLHKFVEKYEENEKKINELSEQISFLKGIDTVKTMGSRLTSIFLPKIFRFRFMLRFEKLKGEMRLSKEDVEALIALRQKQQEPFFASRDELEKMIRSDEE